jgi:hypothetical protein
MTRERLEDLDPHDHLGIHGFDLRQDIELKRRYAKWLLILVAAQMVFADLVFCVYAWAGKSWELSAGVIEVWLAATLVELVGVVAVVTRYLFPRRDLDGVVP